MDHGGGIYYLMSSLKLSMGMGILSTITTGPPPHFTSTLSPKSPPSSGTYMYIQHIYRYNVSAMLYKLACICKVSRGASLSSSILMSLGSAVYGLPPTGVHMHTHAHARTHTHTHTTEVMPALHLEDMLTFSHGWVHVKGLSNNR